MSLAFEAFPKITRLAKEEMIITEKIDGTNAQVFIVPLPTKAPLGQDPEKEFGHEVVEWAVWANQEYAILAGSRNRYVRCGKEDNYGFASWVKENAEELLKLGPGRHFGEWWGLGIQKCQGIDRKYFSLFNTRGWKAPYEARQAGHLDAFPGCVSIVPELYRGPVDMDKIDECMKDLERNGSKLDGHKNPAEGVVICLPHQNLMWKRTFAGDIPKWQLEKEVINIKALTGNYC